MATPSPERAAATVDHEAYRLLFERVDNMVCTLDLAGRFTSINDAGLRLTGYPAGELIGRSALDLVAPEVREEAQRQFERRLFADGGTRPDESVLVARDGTRIPIEISSLVFTSGGRPAGVLGLVRDLTQERSAAAALAHSEQRFRTLLEAAPDAVVITDGDGQIVLANARTEELFSYTREELVGRPIEMLLPRAVGAAHARHRAGYVADPRVRQMGAGLELAGRRKDGSEFPVDVSLSPLQTEDGLLVLAAVRDVTERKRAEAALQESEERFRGSFQSAAIGMALVAPDGRFIEVNNALCELIGYAPDELVGRTFHEITHPDDLELDLECVRRMLSGRIRSYQLEKRYLARDGQVVWALLSVSLLAAADGTPLHFVSQIQDISERKRAQDALEQSEARLAEAQQIARIGSWQSEFARGMIVMSAELCRLFGLGDAPTELTFPELLDHVHPDDVPLLVEAAELARGDPDSSEVEYRVQLPDGSVRWLHGRTEAISVDGEIVGRRGTAQDITARRLAEAERDRLREELHHAQKLEALGRLAGGIAHDFNNMLTAIKGYSELLLESLQPGSGAHTEATHILRAAEQAAALPQQLLAFGRKQALEPRLVDLNEVVDGTSQLLRHLIGRTVELVTEPHAAAPRAFVDAGQIEHVLVNLALNARDAMPDGGTLTIATSNADVDGSDASEHGVSVGPYVVVAVTDTGVGMDDETRRRVFEPFFTTKPDGRGSGLGLPSVYGTVTQSGGFIRVRSAPAEGTTFAIHLPCAVPEAAGAGAQPAVPLRAVLLAEDEAVVRSLAVDVLERAGFRVFAARDGSHALQLYEELAGQIDALVTDMVMPGLGGRELAERIREVQPSLPTVFLSGYTERNANGELDLQGAFLQKPFSTRALARTVREAMGEDAPGPASLTCLVADDHPAVLDSVSRYLESRNIRVLRAADGEEALRTIEERRPDIAVLDITMAPLGGIEVARRAAASAPGTRTVLFTGHRDRALLERSFDAGARGFVLKEAPLAELERAVRTVGAGGTYVDAELSSALASPRSVSSLPPLTTREREVLSLVADGMTNEKVAAALAISPETVQSHVRNAMGKLEADTRTEAVATALRQAIIS